MLFYNQNKRLLLFLQEEDMKVLLSEQLKKLRREKGNTQEDLANHLGITTQAVSKWEREEGYPDITLLPFIASYYNVSVDDLLGVGQIEKEKKKVRTKKKTTGCSATEKVRSAWSCGGKRKRSFRTICP